MLGQFQLGGAAAGTARDPNFEGSLGSQGRGLEAGVRHGGRTRLFLRESSTREYTETTKASLSLAPAIWS